MNAITQYTDAVRANTALGDNPQRTCHGRTPVPNHQVSICLTWFCILLFHSAATFAQPPSIVGIWQLDASASGDPAKELKGIREFKRKKKPDNARPDPNPGPLSDTQRRYWEHANEGNQWAHSKGLAHAGPVQRLLESENLEIVPADNGYLFIYADGYERSVIPNPGGRVFTASGDELVKTDIGFTLTFWKKTTLHFETRIEDGGKLNERVTSSADGNRLTVSIEIDRRDWKWIVKLDRVFNRVDASAFEHDGR